MHDIKSILLMTLYAFIAPVIVVLGQYSPCLSVMFSFSSFFLFSSCVSQNQAREIISVDKLGVATLKNQILVQVKIL